MAGLQLSTGDLKHVRHVVDLCAGAPATIETVREVLDTVESLVGCNLVAFNGMDSIAKLHYHSQTVAAGEHEVMPAEELAVDESDRTFWTFYRRCLPCSYPEGSSSPLVLSIGDFYSEREWRQHPMFVEVIGPRGGWDEVQVSYPDGVGRSVRLLLERARGSRFGEREKFVMRLLQPHLQPLLMAVRTPPPARALLLTRRQREILSLVRLGMPNKQVAAALGISPATVRKHLENVYAQLGVQSRTAAVLTAFAETSPDESGGDAPHRSARRTPSAQRMSSRSSG